MVCLFSFICNFISVYDSLGYQNWGADGKRDSTKVVVLFSIDLFAIMKTEWKRQFRYGKHLPSTVSSFSIYILDITSVCDD